MVRLNLAETLFYILGIRLQNKIQCSLYSTGQLNWVASTKQWDDENVYRDNWIASAGGAGRGLGVLALKGKA